MDLRFIDKTFVIAIEGNDKDKVIQLLRDESKQKKFTLGCTPTARSKLHVNIGIRSLSESEISEWVVKIIELDHKFDVQITLGIDSLIYKTPDKKPK